MRSVIEVDRVLALAREGLNKSEIARRTGIPRATVRDWLKGRTPEQRVAPAWPTDHDIAGPREQYSYLLGMYLGDGCLSEHPRGAVLSLRTGSSGSLKRIRVRSCAVSSIRMGPAA
jgi:hypothetical protein